MTAANGKKLLIECGCTWKRLIKALDYKLDNVVGCLLTHEHKDHSKCVEKVMENGIDVYTGALTFDALGVVDRRAHVIEELKGIIIADEFRIFPFAVEHDAVEVFGYIVQSGGDSLLFVTDTSHIKPRFALQFGIIAICCNYDGETLHALEESGKVNTELAKRLLTSHMEWHETKRYIKEFCNLDKCTEIHLLHMSQSNIDGEKVRAEFERDFMTKTLIAGGAIGLSIRCVARSFSELL